MGYGVLRNHTANPNLSPVCPEKCADFRRLQAGFASVVKVFAWTTEPHFSQPWQMRRQRQVNSFSATNCTKTVPARRQIAFDFAPR
eukprot:167086-Rhodomonas_salina.1